MIINKFIISTITVIILSSCHTSKKILAKSQSSDFILLDSKYENSVPGYIGGFRSTEYYFKILITSNNHLQFDSAWIDNHRYATFMSRLSTTINNKPIEISQGDTLILRVSANANALKAEPPFIYNGKVLIGYKQDSKQKFFLIKEINLQSSPNRQ